MPPIDHALLHRARVMGAEEIVGERDEQGDRQQEPARGPWFPARLMTKRQSVATAAEDGTTRRRREIAYSLIWGTVHEDGTPIVAPTSSDEIHVERDGVVTAWQVQGEPEAFDSGLEVFGGQAELVAVEDSA